MHQKPDILWIITTQWRGQALGCNGDPNASTPVLDALASRSINYQQAITPHPFGPFARAALLTGQSSPENGLCDYYDPLPQSARTIAHELNEHGYHTSFFGKWHLGNRDKEAPLVGEAHAKHPIPMAERGGFTHWEGFESGFLLNDPWLHGTALPSPTRFEGYQSEVLCQRLAEHLARQEPSKACFSILSLEAPHPPYSAPAAGFPPPPVNSLHLRPNVPCGAEIEHKTRAELAGYYAHIQATDHALAGLLSHPKVRDSIIVFTSVHGDMHGSLGLFRKGWPYEESIRVPLLVYLPRSLRRFQLGISSTELVSLLDLHTWTRRWAGIHPGPTLPQSRQFQRCSMPSVVHLPQQCDRSWTAYRSRTHKLVLNDDGTPWLFFRLLDDPYERDNLVNSKEHSTEMTHVLSEAQHWRSGTELPT